MSLAPAPSALENVDAADRQRGQPDRLMCAGTPPRHSRVGDRRSSGTRPFKTAQTRQGSEGCKPVADTVPASSNQGLLDVLRIDGTESGPRQGQDADGRGTGPEPPARCRFDAADVQLSRGQRVRQGGSYRASRVRLLRRLSDLGTAAATRAAASTGHTTISIERHQLSSSLGGRPGAITTIKDRPHDRRPRQSAWRTADPRRARSTR